MRKLLWISLLLGSMATVAACDDDGDTGDDTGMGDDDDDDDAMGYTGITGSLVIDIWDFKCTGTYDFSGAIVANSWCPDCEYSFDTDFAMMSKTGCSFETFSRNTGYLPTSAGIYTADVLTYEAAGTYWYWGVASMSGTSITWNMEIYAGYYTYLYDAYRDYDYSYNGAGTLY